MPGKIIETPKEVIVEKTVTEDIIHDHEIPVSIAQCLQPIMQLMKTNSMKTTAYVYEPKLQEVVVYQFRGDRVLGGRFCPRTD